MNEVQVGQLFVKRGRKFDSLFECSRTAKTVFYVKEVISFGSESVSVGNREVQAMIKNGKIIGSDSWLQAVTRQEAEEIVRRNAEAEEKAEQEKIARQKQEVERWDRAVRLNPELEFSNVFDGDDRLQKCVLHTTDKGTFRMILQVKPTKLIDWTVIEEVAGVSIDYTCYGDAKSAFNDRWSSNCEGRSLWQAVMTVAASYCWKTEEEVVAA